MPDTIYPTLDTPEVLALRQTMLYLLIHSIALPDGIPIYSLCRFRHPERTWFAFTLYAAPKVAELDSNPLSQAEVYLHNRLQEQDIVTLCTDKVLYGICTTAQGSAITGMEPIWLELSNQPFAFSYHWTLGVGRTVPTIAQLGESVFSARHAIKFSLIHGHGGIYDANNHSGIYEGGLTLLTPTELLSIQRTFQKTDRNAMYQLVQDLFRNKQETISSYPVFAYMLALQLIQSCLQTLRNNMPVDRKTFELEQQAEQGIDDFFSLEDLIAYTCHSILQLMERYSLFLRSGQSRPLWLAITYVQEHFSEKLTLNQIAAYAGRNSQYLSAMFSRECGIPISGYVESIRVEEAKKLLLTTDLPIGRIAERVGYVDSKYFSKVFYRATGQCPRDFRKQQFSVSS